MIELHGTKWISYHGALIPDAAPHVKISLSDEATKYLLKNSGAHFLRWTSGFDQERATAFWHVIKDGPCDLMDLSKNTRNQVRKGLKNCSVLPIDPDTLSIDGYEVYRRAMESYHTDIGTLGKDEFQSSLSRAAMDKSIEFWAARDDEGTLLAYAQNKIQDGSCNYQVIKLDPSMSHLYPGYALVFAMTSHYLNDRKMRYVNDGARSIRHETNVQDFLIKKFKFRKAYSQLHISYSLKMGVLVRVLFPFRKLIKLIPGKYAMKANSVMRQEKIRRHC